jgi:outer membrane beta-barrel protein
MKKEVLNKVLGSLIVSFFITQAAYAEVKIKFPEEELSTESVLPVFEDRVAVKNRKVNHKEKFEINFMAGLVTSEPIYDPTTFGASLTYHFDNTRALHIMGAVFSDGLSGSGEDLRGGRIFRDDGAPAGNTFDATKAPHKEFLLAAHYQYTAYYGKISITRDSIMNMTLSGLFGGGAYMLTDGIAPTANIGLSQRLYFSRSVALRFDILFSIFNGPDITSGGTLDPNSNVTPPSSAFEDSIQFDSNIYFGLSFLI